MELERGCCGVHAHACELRSSTTLECCSRGESATNTPPPGHELGCVYSRVASRAAVSALSNPDLPAPSSSTWEL